jgi:hypothetical protein
LPTASLASSLLNSLQHQLKQGSHVGCCLRFLASLGLHVNLLVRAADVSGRTEDTVVINERIRKRQVPQGLQRRQQLQDAVVYWPTGGRWSTRHMHSLHQGRWGSSMPEIRLVLTGLWPAAGTVIMLT